LFSVVTFASFNFSLASDRLRKPKHLVDHQPQPLLELAP
jgi:hypothetical protein